MLRPELKVVVLGDSVMWGQGLRKEDKYALKSVQEIGALLGRQARIVINSTRSGAVILAGKTPDPEDLEDPEDPDADEAKNNRLHFVDTFPHLFRSDEAVRTRFIDDVEPDSQDVALNLHRENPASFPTVEKQVQRVPEAVAQNTELVLLNGGANDLAFDEFLNPQEHRDDFVKHYDPLLKEITFGRVRSLLRQTREKFPKAVIVYTGYFAPFAPGVSDAEMKEMLEHMSGREWYEIWFNNEIHEIEDVDQLVIEAQWRAHFGAARELYWTRKAIAEANAEPAFRGPGVLFVHPQFAAENTVFASNSFFHREYEISKVNDAAKDDRVDNLDNCPRIRHADEMKDLLGLLAVNAHSDPTTFDAEIRRNQAESIAERLLRTLNGPETLLGELRGFAQAPLDLHVVKPATVCLPPVETVSQCSAVSLDENACDHTALHCMVQAVTAPL